MSERKFSSGRLGLLTFLAAFVLGTVIFVSAGLPAGIFSSGGDKIKLLTTSIAGFVALFGATLAISSPFIGLTIWLVDAAFKSAVEKKGE